MKNNFDGVLVVEGASDVAYLSSFINALFFITGGYDINDQKLEFLTRVSKVNKIVILTDPDEAGQAIENKIKNKINGVFVAKISKNNRKSYKKSGVAESNKEEVIKALKEHFTTSEPFNEKYDLNTLVSLDENPSKKRREIVEKFSLLGGNNKAIENQLRMLRIYKEELWK